MGKEVPSQNGKAEMIKRAFSILLAIMLVAFCAGVAAQGVAGSRAGVLAVPPADPTPAPTSVPTEEPLPPTDPPAPPPTDVPGTPAPTDPATPAPTDPTPTDPATPTPTDPVTPAPTDPGPTPKPGLEITTASHLPHAVMGQNYGMRLEANYSDAVFSDVSGVFASMGLKLSASGVISGKANAAGHYTITVKATSASAGGSVRKTFNMNVYDPDGPTPEPTDPPAPTEPAEPTAEPTDFPIDPNARLWASAADTLITVAPGEGFDITLADGISGVITSVALEGELPGGVEFKDELASSRSCGLSGSLEDGTEADFSVVFSGEELSVALRFHVKTGVPTSDDFPEGIRLVPFGGAPRATLLPTQEKRKDEEDDQA